MERALMKTLLDAYSGDRATGYDDRRASSSRWNAEIAQMQRFLAAIRPATVVDCPFGTGRWIPQYVDVGAQVLGIDLSEGMLAEAQLKLGAQPPEVRDRFRLQQASIFDLAPAPDDPAPDLVACIRFLNWIDFASVKKVLDVLTAYGSPHMILGASVVPDGTGPLRRLWRAASLRLINLRRSGQPTQFVHHEGDLVAAIQARGWTIADKGLVMHRNARVNYFYRLQRKTAGG
jgi:SAM-dependent methyltransferase